ncbi:MAG TPA: GNAT family acetyltransferase [Acidimicrobiales bacterium]|jgi:ribosomal protein S18 acetylase RimI-like enzyme|nr:GNAT family acetyltransferase [Acidimicrobiales bacterium]
MHTEELTEDDVTAVTALWTEAGLTRPWNDPEADFQRAVDGSTSAVLGLRDVDDVVGTVMVGFDGHRGWVYYLAVQARYRREGLGRLLMTAAEEWLGAKGATKVQLMIRRENATALGFYERLAYEEESVIVVSRWLDRSA